MNQPTTLSSQRVTRSSTKSNQNTSSNINTLNNVKPELFALNDSNEEEENKKQQSGNKRFVEKFIKFLINEMF